MVCLVVLVFITLVLLTVAKFTSGCVRVKMAMDNPLRALSALLAIDPNCSREQWHEIGRAAIASGLSIEDVDEWSSTASNYAGTKDVQAAFRTIKSDEKTRPDTLYKLAKEAGWDDPAKGQVNTSRKVTRTKPKNIKKPDPVALWERSPPAANVHPNSLAKPAMRYKLLTSEDLKNLPPLRWRIRGVLPQAGIGAVFGPSGSGKSFLVIDVLAAVATGRAWFGCRVKQAPVLYIALEGEAGIAQRVHAHQIRHGDLPPGFRFLLTPLDIRKPDDRAELVKAARAAGLVDGVLVLDTLNRAAPGMDENDSRDMGEVITAAKALQAELGGLVLLVSHTGKDVTKGLRGHSSLHAALDCAVEVRRDGDRREWQIAKAKDGDDGEAHPFRLDVVEVGEDDDGEPVTSCIVMADEAAHVATRPKLPKGGNQRIVWDALGDLLKTSKHFGKAGAPPTLPCVELEAAIEAIAPRLTCEERRKVTRTREAFTGLLANKAIEHREGWLWLP